MGQLKPCRDRIHEAKVHSCPGKFKSIHLVSITTPDFTDLPLCVNI